MNSENYLKDISEIKTLMNKSSKFISLSGISGILAGIYALMGATYAYIFLFKKNNYLSINEDTFFLVFIDLLLITVFSISTAIFLTTKKVKKNNEQIWDTLTQRLLLNFITPLLIGGIYILINLYQNYFDKTIALMLLFYGLALLNASKYTLGDIKYLGYTQVILGLLCTIYPIYGFWFWVIGFGFMHIIYGTIMYLKYDKK